MNKDLWQLKREFLEYCEIEKGQSLLTINNYERYLNRFLVWLEQEKKDEHTHRSLPQINTDENNNETMKQSSNDEKEHSTDKNTKILPEDINREMVRRYRLYINRLYDRNGKELKSTTQNHHVLALRAFLRYLSMQGIKTVSPDEIALAKTGERKVNFLTAEEYQRLLAAPQKSPRDKAILELLFSTGMRVSELTSLNVGDINFERGEIAVLGKGKKVRVVFVSESAIESLAGYLQKRGALQIVLGSAYKVSSNSEKPNTKYVIHDTAKKLPLFLSSRGNRLNVRGIERLVAKYAKVAGITKNVSPHTLRHTFATDLLIAGADIRSVQSLLGHSNISTTQVYTHVTDQHLRDIHQKYHNQNKKLDS